MIRFATIDNVPFIKACIHELAEYEHAAAEAPLITSSKANVLKTSQNIFVVAHSTLWNQNYLMKFIKG